MEPVQLIILFLISICNRLHWESILPACYWCPPVPAFRARIDFFCVVRAAVTRKSLTVRAVFSARAIVFLRSSSALFGSGLCFFQHRAILFLALSRLYLGSLSALSRLSGLEQLCDSAFSTRSIKRVSINVKQAKPLFFHPCYW